MKKSGIARINLAWLIAFGCLVGAGSARADVKTFDNEADFVRKTKSSGPFHAPGALAAKTISVDNGRFTLKPGPNVETIAAQKPADKTFTMAYVSNASAYSNLDIALGSPAKTFGFLVESETGADFAGESEFKVTLFRGEQQVGEATFKAPGAGAIFFGLQATEAFDLLTIREVKGGNQNLGPGGGAADSESFGKFYTDAKSANKGKNLGQGGLTPPPLPPPPPPGQGGLAKEGDEAKVATPIADFIAELDPFQMTLVWVAGGALAVAVFVGILGILVMLVRWRRKRVATVPIDPAPVSGDA
ncbi:MAG: hypothetical protein EXR98_02885 [Gemmataceae bacterium]|nr:hypothetical protein [Gemmataceae bacterium]